MTKAFVTGADGFIGSHLCEALRDQGDEVTGLALYNSFDSFGWLNEVEGVEKVRGDVRDADQMRYLIGNRSTDIVFHLAALVSVPYSFEAPQSFIDTNVTGTLNVLLAAGHIGAKVIHTSTSEVYGSVPDKAINEDMPLAPQSPYAASKVAADALVRSFYRSYGLPAVILRPFNTYGPRQSERAVVATIIRQALDPECRRIELGNLHATRDLTYVDDMVRAFLAVAGINAYGVYNAGGGVIINVRDLGELIKALTGCDKSILSGMADRIRPEASEVVALKADATRLTKRTGWRPKVPPGEGMKRTIDWWRSRPFRKDQVYLT
ncbi:MAG TPA: NAD-dependent epimerase/dehydratase family protein [Aurantimonas coralicida]|uniref:NAD-dependent epimerase/dehydratase family protein n=2 Tax=root TaxID=1 RepID=A0A9C9ND92_9HYPH|nr:NAD-dependent epimerase/dehydratase family protein [Aurantimonas coralicida]HET99661.1 NAD-dependent epimerase/dehydratase family protein [Aurantimonas coralicida]